MRRHIVLVGLPGSGKTTVGRLAAHTLGTRFVDIDVEIARRARLTVEQIFERQGEAAFRAMEREAVERELAAEPTVIAPGGGWAAHGGNLESATERAFTVYLEVSAAEAARRCRAEGAARPLLAGPEPGAVMERLLEAREAFYGRCQAALETDGAEPPDVAKRLVQLARSQGGW